MGPSALGSNFAKAAAGTEGKSPVKALFSVRAASRRNTLCPTTRSVSPPFRGERRHTTHPTPVTLMLYIPHLVGVRGRPPSCSSLCSGRLLLLLHMSRQPHHLPVEREEGGRGGSLSTSRPPYRSTQEIWTPHPCTPGSPHSTVALSLPPCYPRPSLHPKAITCPPPPGQVRHLGLQGVSVLLDSKHSLL